MPNISLTAAEGLSAGFRKKEVITASTPFTVPDGVYKLGFVATGGGGDGEGGNVTTTGEGAGSGANTVGGELFVQPGDSLTITIGGSGGGDTLIENGTQLLVVAQGGVNASGSNGGNSVPPTAINPSFWMVRGGDGGNGDPTSTGESGGDPRSATVDNTSNDAAYAYYVAASGGTGDGARGGGGGGGSSYYGPGGDGGDGDNAVPTAGSSPAATSYGAGGGGAGGAGAGAGGVTPAGGVGIQGIVEVWY